MKKEQFFQKMKDGAEIFVTRYLPDDINQAKAVVQLSHGMIEHAQRYEEFARFLTSEGFIFNAHDHRGHGQTAERAIEQGTGDFGILAEKNGFSCVVNDLSEIILKCKKDFPNLKVILFGHSFGSFVAQSFIEKYSTNIDACILCGTRGPNYLEVLPGKILLHIMAFLFGRKSNLHFISNLFFGTTNKKITNPKTKSDWLSRDEKAVKDYKNDKWCNFSPTTGFFADIMDGLFEIHKNSSLTDIPISLPIFLIAGQDDPIGSYGKTVEKLYKVYKKIGIKNVCLKLYKDARHELLNEINKDEVMKDILEWIKSVALV